MKTLKVVAAVFLTVSIAFVSMGWPFIPESGNLKNTLFETQNAVDDIEVLSSSPHSVLHPEERAAVRRYLAGRLTELGGNPAVFYYDSIPSKFGGSLDIANIYCCLNPRDKDTASSYMLLVAHYDSRFPEETPHGTVCSYGAADDGYGLGVILEIVRGALTYSEKWSQGLKVLFTDAEEHELDGIRCALREDSAVFDNVGLVINVEARGVKGPCLLFETSDGNAELMDFYIRNAQYPYAYSLTSSVYRFMPNFTDFTHLKPKFPGYNLSVIDNLHYYHNDKDNFSNINPGSVAHYGAQLEPVVREYLTGKQYSDPDCFRSDKDLVVFTVPGLRTFTLGRTACYVLNAVVLAMFVLAVSAYAVSGRIRGLRNVLVNALWITAAGISAAVLCTGIVFCITAVADIPFSFTATKFLEADWILAAVLVALTGVSYIIFFIRKAAESDYFVYEHILGALLCVIVLSAVLLFVTEDNFFLMFPAACTLAGLLLHVLVYMNIFSLPAFLLVEMTCLPFLYNLYTALTVGSLGLVMFLAFIYLIMMTSLMRCFMVQKR